MRPHSQVFARYLRAHPSRLPTCPVHIPPAPCTCIWLHGGVQMASSCHPLFMPCQAQLMNSHTVVHAQLTAEVAVGRSRLALMNRSFDEQRAKLQRALEALPEGALQRKQEAEEERRRE